MQHTAKHCKTATRLRHPLQPLSASLGIPREEGIKES